MITPSIIASLAQLQALADYIDKGSSNATFVFFSGTKPESVETLADTANRLVILTLPKPCFKKMNAESIELNQTDASVVVKNGTAVWARLFNGEGKPVADFGVGSDISLNNPGLIQGSTLMLNSIVFKPSI